jgi:hypothetical protein
VRRGTGHVDGGDATAAREARRDGGHARHGPSFGLRDQQKGKREDDDDDITATSAWDPAVRARGRRAVGGGSSGGMRAALGPD